MFTSWRTVLADSIHLSVARRPKERFHRQTILFLGGVQKKCICETVPFYLAGFWRGEKWQTRPVFCTLSMAPPPWWRWWCSRRRWPVCQRPTNPVHFDIHMGAVMILKAAIKLTVAFRESARCWGCRRRGCRRASCSYYPPVGILPEVWQFLPPFPPSFFIFILSHLSPRYLFSEAFFFVCVTFFLCFRFIIFGRKQPLLLNTILKAFFFLR